LFITVLVLRVLVNILLGRSLSILQPSSIYKKF